MFAVILALIVLAAIVLILVVLVQNSKGGGLASNFASSNSIMGVKKTTDTIEKITWGLAGTIIVLSLVINSRLITGSTSSSNSVDTQIDAPAAMPNQVPDVNTPLAPAPQE